MALVASFAARLPAHPTSLSSAPAAASRPSPPRVNLPFQRTARVFATLEMQRPTSVASTTISPAVLPESPTMAASQVSSISSTADSSLAVQDPSTVLRVCTLNDFNDRALPLNYPPPPPVAATPAEEYQHTPVGQVDMLGSAGSFLVETASAVAVFVRDVETLTGRLAMMSCAAALAAQILMGGDALVDATSTAVTVGSIMH